MSDYIYPFDPTGKATSNLIQNERQTISPPNWTDFYFVIPKMAPYFRDSLRVVHRPSGKILVEGQDYHCTHWFHDASYSTGNRIYGSITLLDKTLSGLLELEYQTLGGEWVIDEDRIASILSNTLVNPRTTVWEEVVEMPHAFPPIDHEWNLEDLKGVEDVVDKLDEIANVLQQTSDGTITGHIESKENPHQVTKAQVGLGSVENYPIAGMVEAKLGKSNELYMTPLRTKDFYEHNFLPTLTEHKEDRTNPHGVTKVQIGLGLVNNYQVASESEAVEGKSNELYMTPLRTKELIDSVFSDTVFPHINDKNNPHQVTKAQVGLGLVENYPIAGIEEIEEVISNSHYMTPIRTYQLLNNILDEVLGNHVSREDNPHSVTAGQVGAYTKDEVNLLLMDKVGVNDTAANSERLGNMTLDEIVNFLNGGDVTQTYPQYLRFGGVTPTPEYLSEDGTVIPAKYQGEHWSYLMGAPIDLPVGKVDFYVSGLGGVENENLNALCRFDIATGKLDIYHMSDVSGFDIFYTRVVERVVGQEPVDPDDPDGEYVPITNNFRELWVRGFGERNDSGFNFITPISGVDHTYYGETWLTELKPQDLIKNVQSYLFYKSGDTSLINGGTF